VPSDLLLDTGALASILDRSQNRHREFSEFFAAWTGQIVTTEAVVTESTYLLGRVAGGAMACLDGRRGTGFADATLVVLAEELGTDVVLTTDQRDFSVYRIGRNKRFNIAV
jgi:predicted nucleic acid-binding protein